MKNLYTLRKLMFLLAVLLFSGTVSAQLTGTKDVPGDYPTLAAAIADLNTQGVGEGGVTINLLAGNPQTAPAGGYVIGGTGTAILTTTDATKQVVIMGNGNAITAPTTHTAGALNDAIFKIIGADYITIDNFMMYENAANTTTAAATNNMTEFGVALFYVTTTDGAQYNTIKGCTIDLDRTYQNTFGIYSNSTHTATAVTTSATATTGNNNGLVIIGNTITDVNNGIVVVGPTAAADLADGLTIGGSLANANTITNFGTTGTFSSYANVSGTVNGILARNTKNINISFNTITSSNGGVSVGTINGIQIPAFSSGPTGTFTTNISNNTLSVKSGVAAGAINGINNPSGSASATSTININGNNFTECGHTVAGSGNIIFIMNAGTHQFQNINSNTFTNLSVNTTGNVTFISNTNTLPANGIKNVNNNAIVTAFNKTGAGGTVWLYIDGGSSTTGTTVINDNNNFSNITVTGGTTIAGWSNTDGTGATPTKVFTGNVFTNWTGGTSAITALNTNFGNTVSVTNNTITNITGQGAITGLIIGSSGTFNTPINVSGNTITGLSSTGAGGIVTGLSYAAPTPVSGTNTVNNNTINNLSSTSTTATVAGISSSGSGVNISNHTIYGLSCVGTTSGVTNGIMITGGALVNVFKNKIYDLNTTSAFTTTPGVNGILISGGGATGVNVYNNLIGDLKAPIANSTDAIRGISITSTTATTNYNIYYNTIQLAGTSTGTNFGTSGIFHTASATATTATLNLRNNIVVNNSTPNGTGLTVAFRRSAGTAGMLANYASASNNNLFFAGTPGASNLIYSDGTSSAQTMAQYKAGVFTAGTISPRDAASFSENPDFISTAGASANFLHLSTTTPTQCESGAAPIAGITDDFDGNARHATTPDVGADEGDFMMMDLTAPSISYTPLPNTASLASRTLAVTITDASGVGSGANQPVLYWRIGAAAYTGPVAPTSVVGNVYTFSFGAGVVAGDVVNYFVVAQDAASTPNVGSFPAGATVTANPPLASAGPATPSSYSIMFTLCGDKTVGAGGDYTTLTAAIADINSKELCGPLTLTLTNADYSTGETFPLVINANPGSSAVNTITIKPSLANTTITGAAASAALIRILTSHVTIDGAVSGTTRDLTITNTSTTAPQVISIASTGTTPITNVTVKNTVLINGVNTSSALVVADAAGTAGYFSNITIQNNSVQKAYIGIYFLATVAPGNGSGTLISQNSLNAAGANSIRLVGIYVQGVDGATVSDNTVGNIVNTVGESIRGIWFATGTVNSTISGNVIGTLSMTATSAFSAVGILVSSGVAPSNVNILNNSISNVSTAGTSVAYGVWVTGASSEVHIRRNRISNIKNTNAGGYSAVGLALGSTLTSANITAQNNLISDVAGYGWSSMTTDNGYGINILSGGGYSLHYNTVVLNTNQTAVTGNPAALIISSTVVTANSLDIRNNIFSISSTVGNRFAVICNAASTVFGFIDFNNYYSSDVNLGFLVANQTNLTAWKAATGKDANSMSILPPFVSPTDYKLTNCSLSNGTPIAGVTTDLDGVVRSATDPTIGAYEFVVVPNAPTAVFSPLSGATGVPVSGSVTITFSQDVRKLNNAPITPADLSLITFKKVSDMSDVPFTLTYSSKVLTVTPSVSLAGESQYTLSVTGVENECNEILSGPNSTTFTTGSDDVTPPLYVSSSVASATPDKIVLVFNENVALTNANGFVVTVNGAGVAITGAVAAATNVTLTIATPVVKGDVVTLEYSSVTGTVTDIALNPLASFGPVSVTNNVLSPAKDFITFGFTQANNPSLTADYSGVIGANTVTLSMPFGTDVTALVASFTTSPDVQHVKVGTVTQVSGVTPNNFTALVTYIITAEDGTTKNYAVTVTIYYPTPYAQGFNGSAPGWSIFNAGTGNNWGLTTTNPYSGTGALAYVYNTTNAANAWAFSPGIELIAGKTYVIQFWQRVHSASYPEKLKLTIGKGNNVAAQTTILWDNSNLVNTTYTLRSVLYTPTESGLFNVAFHCYSAMDMWTLYVDDLLVREASANANLSSLSASAGILSPAFDAAVTEYSVNLLSNQVAVPTVIAVKADVNATMVINQATALTGAAAQRTATVNVTAENGVATKTYSVLFSKPVFNVSPTVNNFGTVITGNASAAQEFVITNTGSTGLNIQSIALAGANASEFTLTDANSYPASVTTGEHTVSVVFAPTTAGAKVATLVITEVGNATPYTVNLTGTGQLPTYTVTFAVDGANGTLGATVDGSAIETGALVQQGKDVVFTATPDAAYRVKEWKLNGATVGGTSTTYTLSNLMANANVTVEFELIPVYNVTFNVVDQTSVPLADAVVTFNGVAYPAGVYTIANIPAGTYAYSVAKAGYTSATGNATVVNQDVSVTATLTLITYTVTFNVVDVNSNAIADAVVTFDGVAAAAGQYVFTNVAPGTYAYSVAKAGYTTATGTATVVNQDVSVTATLMLITYTVTFNVEDANSNAIADAVVTFDGVAAAAGQYVFTNVAPGTYAYSVGKTGYVAVTGSVTVVDQNVTEIVVLNQVGVNSNTFANFSAYPNPFRSSITLSNPSVVSRVVITNIIGQNLVDIRTNGAESVETNQLPAGVYMVTFEAANGERLVRKMVKK